MSLAVYEFPLNEKVRNYLRVEHLFNALHDPDKICKQHSEVQFFRDFFTLLDLIERIDLKTELLRDLKNYTLVLDAWMDFPNVDKATLHRTKASTEQYISDLLNTTRIGKALKTDKFLSAIRQRFSIPGATCSFDLPKLHYWLSLPEQQKLSDCKRWLSNLSLLEQSVQQALSFIRNRKHLVDTLAENGFYQGVADNKVELIRIEQNDGQGYYPTLSGNKYRYSIRFMRFTPEDDQAASMDENIAFKMACC
ncbi:MAG: cell division protein ZapD [Glaciecola sp.]|jgi:cell division protein ZapD